MKKILFSLAVVALMASCSSKNNESADDSIMTDDIDVEDVAVMPEAVAPGAEEVAVVEAEEVEVADAKSSVKFDKWLDDYEKVVDKLIAVNKKAQAGDISALTEMASVMERIESLDNDIDTSDLTPAQLARYQKIAAKVASAAGMGF